MSFTSFGFVAFFCGLLVSLRCVASRDARLWLLLAASVGFYLSWNVPCIALVLLVSVVNGHIGKRLFQTQDAAPRRRFLLASVAMNLGLLAYFKYSGFFLGNVTSLANAFGAGLALSHYEPVLPPGISYFTFASLAYVVDVYYERMEPAVGLRDYTLFVSFFPKLLSGPIVRAKDFLPQLRDETQTTDWRGVETGLAQFLVGAVKKAVIADQMALNVNQIFATPARLTA